MDELALPAALRRRLAISDAEVEARWAQLMDSLAARFGRSVGLEGVLFLIGVNALGRGFEPRLEKERKQDLIMEGTYHAFAALGVYEQVGLEADGFAVWERRLDVPRLAVEQQEKLLHLAILAYFEPYLPEAPA